MRSTIAALWIGGLVGCGEHTWSGPDECAALASGARQDECWAATLPALFRTDKVRAEQLTREKVSDPRVRDYIWLTVTRDIDSGSYRYCDEIQDQALAQRCRVLVSRPHLHRKVGEPPTGGGQTP